MTDPNAIAFAELTMETEASLQLVNDLEAALLAIRQQMKKTPERSVEDPVTQPQGNTVRLYPR